MLRYAITDRQMFSGNESEQLDALAAQARRLAVQGVDLLQLRERDLLGPVLEALLRRVVEKGHSHPGAALKILLNGPAHIAAKAGADGVHLRAGAGEQELESARIAFRLAGLEVPLVSLSCHSVQEARQAALAGFDYLLFGPVFEKRIHSKLVAPGLGLEQLREASRVAVSSRLIALGGVTEQNAPLCLQAGAAGVAAIRLFL